MTQSVRSLFWIEPSRVAALLEKVDAEASGPPIESRVREISSDRGGIEDDSTNKEAEPAGGAPAPRLPEIVVPPGSLETRLDALFTWLTDVSGCDEAFVADKEGLALADRGARPELVAAAAAVAERWAEMRGTWSLPAGPSVAIDLEGDDRLHLVLADSRWGRLNLGFVTRVPLTRNALDLVADALQRTVSEQDQGTE